MTAPTMQWIIQFYDKNRGNNSDRVSGRVQMFKLDTQKQFYPLRLRFVKFLDLVTLQAAF